MTFGERLIELRKEHGYAKRADFAEKLGIPSTTLRNYETNAREPGHLFLKKISDLFNVSVDYLLCLTDEKEKFVSYKLKASEYEHIKLYRSLDTHGKEVVDTLINIELKRLENNDNNIIAIAAHNDNLNEDQLKLMHEDIDEL